MFYQPRLPHRIYSWIRGRFWIPCPICKRGFGEHEWMDGHELWLTERDSVAVCPNCGDRAADMNNESGPRPPDDARCVSPPSARPRVALSRVLRR